MRTKQWWRETPYNAYICIYWKIQWRYGVSRSNFALFTKFAKPFASKHPCTMNWFLFYLSEENSFLLIEEIQVWCNQTFARIYDVHQYYLPWKLLKIPSVLLMRWSHFVLAAQMQMVVLWKAHMQMATPKWNILISQPSAQQNSLWYSQSLWVFANPWLLKCQLLILFWDERKFWNVKLGICSCGCSRGRVRGLKFSFVGHYVWTVF